MLSAFPGPRRKKTRESHCLPSETDICYHFWPSHPPGQTACFFSGILENHYALVHRTCGEPLLDFYSVCTVSKSSTYEETSIVVVAATKIDSTARYFSVMATRIIALNKSFLYLSPEAISVTMHPAMRSLWPRPPRDIAGSGPCFFLCLTILSSIFWRKIKVYVVGKK